MWAICCLNRYLCTRKIFLMCKRYCKWEVFYFRIALTRWVEGWPWALSHWSRECCSYSYRRPAARSYRRQWQMLRQWIGKNWWALSCLYLNHNQLWDPMILVHSLFICIHFIYLFFLGGGGGGGVKTKNPVWAPQNDQYSMGWAELLVEWDFE